MQPNAASPPPVRRGRPPTRYLKRISDGKLLIWTPHLAARSDMVECDNQGRPFDTPDSDQKRIQFLERQIQEKDNRIFDLEQQLQQAYAVIESNTTPAPAPNEQVAQTVAGVEMPAMPSDKDLYGEAVAAEQAANGESTVLQLHPEPPPVPPEEQEDLVEVLPKTVAADVPFNLEDSIAEIKSKAKDAGDLKTRLAALAMTRYQATLDHRYTADKLESQLRELEASRSQEL